LAYKTEVENQLNKKIKKVRSNRDGENLALDEFCETEDIIHEVTPPDELYASSSTFNNLWGDAILSICHLQNRIAPKEIGKTPYEL
jgi:hypothetical protein